MAACKSESGSGIVQLALAKLSPTATGIRDGPCVPPPPPSMGFAVDDRTVDFNENAINLSRSKDQKKQSLTRYNRFHSQKYCQGVTAANQISFRLNRCLT